MYCISIKLHADNYNIIVSLIHRMYYVTSIFIIIKKKTRMHIYLPRRTHRDAPHHDAPIPTHSRRHTPLRHTHPDSLMPTHPPRHTHPDALTATHQPRHIHRDTPIPTHSPRHTHRDTSTATHPPRRTQHDTPIPTHSPDAPSTTDPCIVSVYQYIIHGFTYNTGYIYITHNVFSESSDVVALLGII